MNASIATRTLRSHKRRSFQYSLRLLLAFVVLASIGMSWTAVTMRRAKMQKEAVEALTASGAKLHYDYEINSSGMFVSGRECPGPAFLRDLLGQDCFARVSIVNLNYQSLRSQKKWATDAELEPVKKLPRLGTLTLHNSQITDVGLEHIEGLTQLENLDLSLTQVTDAGLQHLVGLRKCWMLDLGCTQVTGPGLECLPKLAGLHSLFLNDTRITDDGLQHIRAVTQLECLSIDGTLVTDAGVKHLLSLDQLRELGLDRTHVTDSCLEVLKELQHLEWLSLVNTRVTAVGVERFQRMFPNCKINWTPPPPGERHLAAAQVEAPMDEVPVGLGATRGKLLDLLGEPTDTSIPARSQAMIWKYDGIQYRFGNDGRVWLIYTDYFPNGYSIQGKLNE